MWKKVLDYFLARLNEASTYVAFFNFLAYIGVVVNPDLKDIIINLCLAIDALVLFFVPENKDKVEELKYLKYRIQMADSEKGLERIKEAISEK